MPSYHRPTHPSRPQKDTQRFKTRRTKERDMIFGIRAVIEAIDAGKQIDKIVMRRDMGGELARVLMSRVKATTIPVQFVPQEKLDQYTDKNHQGVIAFISPITLMRIEDLLPTLYESGRTPLLVVLDGVTDMRNFGAIARTCECAGVDALIVPMKGGAAISGDAVKTSAGALLSLPVCREDSIGNCLKYLAASGVQLVAATEKTDRSYTEADFTLPTAIVLGAEDTGIDECHLQLCNTPAAIPICGQIESLNVSVAAGVIIYEAIRQRRVH